MGESIRVSPILYVIIVGNSVESDCEGEGEAEDGGEMPSRGIKKWLIRASGDVRFIN